MLQSLSPLRFPSFSRKLKSALDKWRLKVALFGPFLGGLKKYHYVLELLESVPKGSNKSDIEYKPFF